MGTIILEQCQVTATPDHATITQTLPLLHFDIAWLPFHPLQHLFFYDIPACSKSHFLDTIVPNLKHSLSLTLNHFFPVAGNILFPLAPSDGGMPVSHYAPGDSVSLIIAQSNADFIHLTGNHLRNSDEFHIFAPQLPQATYSSDYIKIPLLALQVTFFPNQGMCIGFTNHHAVADGISVIAFLHAWASANKSNGATLDSKFLPSFDRSSFEDPKGLRSMYWDRVKNYRPTVSSTNVFPTNKVRATFVMNEADIRKLKNYVLNKRPSGTSTHLSSFTIVYALVWTCLAKSAASAREEVADDEPEYLTCPADCRAYLNPPLPANYFGNCLKLVKAELTHGILKENGGFVDAVQAIGEGIQKTVYNEKGILDGSENSLRELGKLNGKRNIGVTGSPRFDLYGADYGWGRAKKIEALHIDCNESISLCKARDLGGVEIGLSFTKDKVDAFAAFFNEALRE